MRYRELFFDGSNGWCLGDVVTAEEAFTQSSGSRNGDGLLETSDGETLWVPLDEGFPLNPECAGEREDEDEDE